ncbi:MAG TPA: M23 family metallopeptidase [Bacteroidales bacterium]|jgi:Membrane proteins related to metalloendopeptidases
MTGLKDEGKKIKQQLLERLRDKYRLVILNEETFEERFSLRLSRLNVFVVLGALSIIIVFITSYIIAFTPLREYIPGYADVHLQRNIYELQLKADSIENAFASKDKYIENLKTIFGENTIPEKPQTIQDTAKKKNYSTITDKHSTADSLLRSDYENQNKYNLFVDESADKKPKAGVTNLYFFTPIKGILTSKFDPAQEHYGIDIVAERNEAIKSVQDGTVIFTGWTVETGYVMTIQHPGNIVSVYKHNSVLLKKVGNFVRAGETIAIIGESGELSTGPHLHLELWINGNPVNPTDYMSF